MPWTRDTTTSIRENLLEQVKIRFAEMATGVGEYSTTWNKVARTPIDKPSKELGNALCVLEGREVKTKQIGYYVCNLTVALEFHLKLSLGDVPSTELNRALVDVERMMMSDLNMGGIAVNVEQVQADTDIEGAGDKTVSGAAVFVIQYRHKLTDPRKLVGE